MSERTDKTDTMAVRGGAGTTIVMAEAIGRAARSAELDPHYCDVIRKRWADFAVGKDADWQGATPEEGGEG